MDRRVRWWISRVILWGWFLAGATALPQQVLPEYRIVDLTHRMHARIPVWPGTPSMVLEPLATFEQNGYFANRLCMAEHFGTHMDAPVHFRAGQWDPAAIPVRHLVAPAVVIDIRGKVTRNPDAVLTVRDIRRWEQRHGTIPSGSVVILYTGWAERWNDPDAYRNTDAEGTMHFPGFSGKAVQFLVKERHIVGLGIDTLSVDPGISRDFAAHHAGARANVYNLENLTNLDRLPPKGTVLIVAPLKLAGGSGTPVRVFALVPKNRQPERTAR